MDIGEESTDDGASEVACMERFCDVRGAEFDDDMFSSVDGISAVLVAAFEDVWEDQGCHGFIRDVELHEISLCNDLFKQRGLSKLRHASTYI